MNRARWAKLARWAAAHRERMIRDFVGVRLPASHKRQPPRQYRRNASRLVLVALFAFPLAGCTQIGTAITCTAHHGCVTR